MQVIVAGAGIIGLTLAFELLELGVDVQVLVAEPESGTATHTAAGMLAPASEADVEHPDLVPFALDSRCRYPHLIERVEAASGQACGYRDQGFLWVALHRDHRAEIEHLQGFMAQRSLQAQMLTSKALRRLEPALSPRVVGGCHIAMDHQVDPRALRAALLAAIAARGGNLIADAALAGVVVEAGKVTGVRAQRPRSTETLACDHAVLALGAWLERPIDGLPWRWQMRPIKGQVLRLRGTPLLEHVVRTPDVYLVPRADGRLIIGASAEEQGFDTRAMAGPTFELLRHAIAAVPEIQELELEEISVGLRPATADHLPIIGQTDIDGLWVSGGHFRNGILLAAGSAWHLARQLVSGDPAATLAAFAPTRQGVISHV